jgi:hypothetical protein
MQLRLQCANESFAKKWIDKKTDRQILGNLLGIERFERMLFRCIEDAVIAEWYG